MATTTTTEAPTEEGMTTADPPLDTIQEDTVSGKVESTTDRTMSETSGRSSGTSVGFSTVHVHKHRLSMGDNPGVSGGVPLTLAWEQEESELYDVNEFEEQAGDRKLSKYTKRAREALVSQRHTRDSIVRVTDQVNEIQKSRKDNENDKDFRRRRRESGAAKKEPFFKRWLRK